MELDLGPYLERYALECYALEHYTLERDVLEHCAQGRYAQKEPTP